MTHCLRYAITNKATLGLTVFVMQFKTESACRAFLSSPPKEAHGFDYWQEEDLENTGNNSSTEEE